MGMILDPRTLAHAWPWALGLALAAVAIRVGSVLFALTLVGRSPSEAARTALLLTPLGEFSFLIVQLGITQAVLPKEMFPAAVGASVATALAAPWLTRHGDWLAERIAPVDGSRIGRFIAAYRDLLERMARTPRAGWIWRPVQARLRWAALEVAIATAFLAAGAPIAEWAALNFTGVVGLEPDASRALAWAGIAVLAAIPLLAAWRNLSTVSLVLAEAASRDIPRRQLWQPLLDGVLRLFAAFVLINLVVVVVPWGEAGIWAGSIAVVAGLSAAVFFGRRLMRLHNEAETALRAQVAEDAPAPLPDWVRPASEWPMQLIDVTLDETTSWRGARLRDTNLRQASGCSIVQIERGGVCLLNPGPDERLFPGDQILVLGEPDRLPIARDLLTRSGGTRPDSAPASLRTILVPGRCHHAGTTLAQLDIARQTGAQVLGLKRGKERLAPVPAQERLLPGDELLFLATAEQDVSLRAWLGEAPPKA
jgi:CPA2 family monovalent cation:H+ antiporter-2